MKFSPRKLCSLVLALAIVLSLPVVASASPALGDDLDERALTVGYETEWTSSRFWSNSQSDLRAENYVTYSPSSKVTPIVTYGESITSRTKLTTMAAQLEKEGYRVVAGINGDFYNTANGVPLGLVVTDGVIRSGSSYYYALGFMPDGEVIFGTPNLITTVNAVSSLTGEPMGIAVQDINKDRTDKGVYLYTYDFNAKHTTGTTAVGTDVVLSLVEGPLSVGGTVKLQVEEVLIDNGKAVNLTEDTFVLSANNSSPALYRELLQQLAVGDIVTVSVRSEDERWNEVDYAVGTLYQLVDKGQVHNDTSLVSGSAPRTAVGIKRNGDIVFYTIDGRQSGHSVGATYTMVAKRLIELGCETAFAMDGGGSTGMLISLPGETASLQNKPSDGYERAVTNQIFLVTPADSSNGFGGGIYVRPESYHVLAGANVAFRTSPYDSNYFPAEGKVSVSASDGEIEDNILHTPLKGSKVTISASASGRSGKAEIRLVTSPDSITLRQDGKKVESLLIGSEESVQLDASAISNHLPLLAQNSCFTWELSDELLGTIDENGLFTAGNRNVKGVITVSAGSTSVELPVEVKNGDYFTDIADSFARKYINSLCERGVVTGKDDGTFAPNDPVTRQQFAAMLYRALELNDADYEDLELPFVDADGLRSYSRTPVKALYSLGIINGSTSGGKLYFSPFETLSRAQACAFVARAMGVSSEETPDYTDLDNFPSYAPSCVGALSELGIIGGYDDGSFRPRANMTRAQVCKVLYLMLENQ